MTVWMVRAGRQGEDALLRNYDRFDEDLRAEPPLKRVWALVQEEE